MKKVKAVQPYMYDNVCNFKSYPYFAWQDFNMPIATAYYPCKLFHGIAYNYNIPKLYSSSNEARLRFVSGYSILFDTFPDYVFYEIIPVIWDCWPQNVPRVEMFFKKYGVKTAIFTSSQTADNFRQIFPEINILTITEGVNVELYNKGKELINRKIDILEVGRGWVEFFKTPLLQNINHIKTGNFNRAFKTDEDFRIGLSDTKVTINVPRCDVDKETAGNIETLTQRYWECMLSRVVMVGRAPKELIDLIGYNPVIEWDEVDAAPLINSVLLNIMDYQQLVDKNYEVALKFAPWNIRIQQIVEFLTLNGYKLK